MNLPVRTARPAFRAAAARLSAYAAFGVSFAFAAAIIFGIFG